MAGTPRCRCPGPGDAPFGVVEDDERVGRLILDPKHIKENGELRTQITDKRDLLALDQSVSRVAFMSPSEIRAKAQRLIDNPHVTSARGGVVGYAEVAASDLRELPKFVEEDRDGIHVCIIDSPINDETETDLAHASFGFPDPEQLPFEPHELLQVRRRLAKLLSKTVRRFDHPVLPSNSS